MIPHCFGMAWEYSLDGSIKVVLTDFACSKTFQRFYLSGFTLLYRWVMPSVCLVFTNFKLYRKVIGWFNFPKNNLIAALITYIKMALEMNQAYRSFVGIYHLLFQFRCRRRYSNMSFDVSNKIKYVELHTFKIKV